MFSVRDKGINKKVKLISFQLVIRINVSNYFNIILSRLVGMPGHRMVPPPPLSIPSDLYGNLPVPINPLHPNISIYTLHTLLYTFPLVLTRRMYLTIKVSLVGDHFLYSHDLNE